jgi:serine beta-lactamase-like protein LACTB, mitochondrial
MTAFFLVLSLFLHDLQKSSGTPGLSVAVAVNGQIVYAEGAGNADLENLVPATPATVYNIGSVSKVITAVAVMQLVERGNVSLDDPIQKYVPEFPVKPEGTITIRHLLTHTSGIRHYKRGDFPGTPDNENTRPYASWIDGLKIFAGEPLQFAPGTRYLYSSYAVNLLQGVVERASGQPFEQYLAQNVWRPAGMAATTFDVPARIVPRRARSYRIVDGGPVNYFYNDLTYKFASGGMMSTVEDLVRFGAAFNHNQLLKSETVAQMAAPQLENDEFEQGIMWRIFRDAKGRTFLNHCGSVKGFNACVVDYPSEDVVVALAGNGEDATPARRAAVAFAQFFLKQPAPVSR